jgi:hypothetical protein
MLKRAWRAWKEISSFLSLGNLIYGLVLAVAGVSAGLSTAWPWYWATFSWAGVPIAFLVACLVLSLSSYLAALAALILSRWWRGVDEASSREAETEGKHYIDHEQSRLFLDPPKYQLWKARIRFSRSGDRLKIRLDYSSHSGGMGNGFWSAREQLLLRELNSFAKGQDIDVELMALDEREPVRFWRWAVDRNGRPLVSRTMHHCRLAFVDNRVVDNFSFIVIPSSDKKMLSLVGEHLFAFASRWRKDDSRAQ